MWETGVKTHTQKQGSGECSVKNENKHFVWESSVLLRNCQEFSTCFTLFFPCGPWTIIVPLFAIPEPRKDPISVVFPRSPMIVRSGKFSVSEQTKNSRDQSSKESVCYNFKEANITVSISGCMNIPLGCYLTIFHPTNDQCMLEASWQYLLKEVLCWATKSYQGQSTATSPNQALGKRIQDWNLTFRAKLINQAYLETLITPLSEVKFKDSPSIEMQRRYCKYLFFCHTILSNSA